MLQLLFFFFFSTSAFSSTVLVIGDSHSVGPFGWALDENLRAEGYHVATYASCGSIAGWWMKGGVNSNCGYFARNLSGKKIELTQTPSLKNLIVEVSPNIVLMQFGGNYVHYSDEFIVDDVTKILTYLKSQKIECFWVSNPDGRANRHLSPRILKLLEKSIDELCPLFNSHLVTRYPETGGDGIHYWFKEGMPIAKQWASEVVKRFKESF